MILYWKGVNLLCKYTSVCARKEDFYTRCTIYFAFASLFLCVWMERDRPWKSSLLMNCSFQYFREHWTSFPVKMLCLYVHVFYILHKAWKQLHSKIVPDVSVKVERVILTVNWKQAMWMKMKYDCHLDLTPHIFECLCLQLQWPQNLHILENFVWIYTEFYVMPLRLTHTHTHTNAVHIPQPTPRKRLIVFLIALVV